MNSLCDHARVFFCATFSLLCLVFYASCALPANEKGKASCSWEMAAGASPRKARAGASPSSSSKGKARDIPVVVLVEDAAARRRSSRKKPAGDATMIRMARIDERGDGSERSDDDDDDDGNGQVDAPMDHGFQHHQDPATTFERVKDETMHNPTLSMVAERARRRAELARVRSSCCPTVSLCSCPRPFLSDLANAETSIGARCIQSRERMGVCDPRQPRTAVQHRSILLPVQSLPLVQFQSLHKRVCYLGRHDESQFGKYKQEGRSACNHTTESYSCAYF